MNVMGYDDQLRSGAKRELLMRRMFEQSVYAICLQETWVGGNSVESFVLDNGVEGTEEFVMVLHTWMLPSSLVVVV